MKKFFVVLSISLILFTISAVSADDNLMNETNINPETPVVNVSDYNYSLETNDLTKTYRNDSQFEAKVIETPSSFIPLTKPAKMIFEVNGVMYYRNILNSTSKLNINLDPGTYTITTYYGLLKNTNTITVLPTLVENNDLVKFYKNDSQYTVKVLNPEGKNIGAGKVVTFNINGVFYTRQTNDEGIAKLNINLQPGDYIITAEYEGCRVSNKIIVRPTLFHYPITTIGDGAISVRVLDGNGEGIANEKISININGKIYEFNSENYGILIVDGLKINLPPSDYLYTASYNGYSISGIWHHHHGVIANHDEAPWALEKIYTKI